MIIIIITHALFSTFYYVLKLLCSSVMGRSALRALHRNRTPFDKTACYPPTRLKELAQ